LEQYWKKEVTFLPAGPDYIHHIGGSTAAVIIGDRALQQLNNFVYVYDLSVAWKAFTGLPFVFAAWVANKELPAAFKEQFNKANAYGLQHIDDVVAENYFPEYDLKTYYTENIHYLLDAEKLKGLDLFLSMIAE
jgi:chorismate dehydratase